MKYAFWNLQDFFFLNEKEHQSWDNIKNIPTSEWELEIQQHNWKHNTDSINKPQDKIEEIANIIKNLQCNFIGLSEIGGYKSLSNLNKFLLNKDYKAFVIEKNSSRGIYCGALVKKDAYKKIDIVDHSDTYKFSRNLIQYNLINEQDKIESIIIVVHLKSQNGDHNGVDQRYHEIKALMNIVNNQKAINPETPIILMGDFNGLARKDECQFEFDEIHYNNYINLIELNKESVQYSHFGFLKNGQKNYIQLDYIFVESKYLELFDLEQTKIDNILFNPNSYDERRKLPSDHLPIICKLKKA